MRSSPTVLRTVRRLASEVLASAEAAQKKFPDSPTNAYFNELPPILKSFFQKYPPEPFRSYSDKPTLTNAENANPFLANKHPVTQNWHKPKYSMRRQADLWKAAYRFGIEDLLPKLLHNKTFYEARYDTAPRPRGSLLFKLTRGERSAPRREREVQEGLAQADSKIAERKGKRFVKFLEQKKRVGYI